MLEHLANVCVPPQGGGDNRKKTYDYESVSRERGEGTVARYRSRDNQQAIRPRRSASETTRETPAKRGDDIVHVPNGN
ncbi:hypothetical protein A3D60_02740 [Candidatus Uhrbacteria bacterium RIFCSPHIGHO2_02_FULL_47_29]|nr:MAG: hypothetical protein A3D60_02740 [Candidatus Uhrbacteria bacterium RIFCSPHIGHO2_02_FULL_47_29]OGL85974.1 MAG: hypothetical protein A3I37_00370 [Candidatus Uhrbacteria bacterium RIFCSPLOWO2_02_FULL_46_19]